MEVERSRQLGIRVFLLLDCDVFSLEVEIGRVLLSD